MTSAITAAGEENLLRQRPGEAGETVEVRGHTSYGDITIHHP